LLSPAGVLVFVTLFRFAAVSWFPVNPLEPDYREYWVLGRAIAERGAYDFGDDWRADPILARSSWQYLYEERGALLRPPGYPAVIAALQLAIGDDLRGHQVALALVDGITAVALLAIGRSLAGDAAGFGAVALFVLSPGTTYVVTRMGREPFIGLFAAFALLGTLRAIERPGVRRGATTGLLFGIGGYFKETLFGVGGATALFLLGLARVRRNAALVRAAVALLVVLLACPLPWIARNAALHEGFVGFSNVSGLATWIGVVPAGWLRSQPESVRTELQPALATDALDANRRLWEQVRRFAREAPGRVAAAVLRNAALFWSPLPRGVWMGDLPFRMQDAVSLAFYSVLFVLGAAGLWLKREDPASALVLWLLLCLTAAHSLTVSFPRYRLPFDTLLLPFAGIALARLGARGARSLAAFRGRGD
jgi:4-amino-4-deoxy-L-arabinose transferase-like glycosyltransferase